MAKVLIILAGVTLSWEVTDHQAFIMSQNMTNRFGTSSDRTIGWQVHDAVTWDDRKDLSWEWQKHQTLPEEGLSDKTYAALLAIAKWGATRVLRRQAE